MDLQSLIDKGEEMRDQRYNSPIVDMWQNDVKAAVSQYGQETYRVLEHAMFFGQMIMSEGHGQQMHNDMISKVQELLNELIKRNPVDTQYQSRLIEQKKEEARATLNSKFKLATFNGPVTFGDNSPINNIQLGEIMMAIISQAEAKLPEGSEKNKILEALKGVTTNPTFAAITGASLPEIIKKLMGQ